jgi:HemY protein
VKAAEKLVVGQPQHAESRLLVGRLAAAAGLTGRARQELDALVASGAADRRAYLALSDLEEAEGGDTPDSRAAQAKWLRLAATAAPEPRWRCSSCGAEPARWQAVCPGCGSVGTIAWTSPQQTTLLPR